MPRTPLPRPSGTRAPVAPGPPPAPAALDKLSTLPDLVERVYRSLLQAISGGMLLPGQRITQEEVAAQLAVSRQPVLQAMRQLKSDGLLQAAPGRGVQVAPLDAVLMHQIYQVRGALDALAARLATQRRAQIDPALIRRGRQTARGKNVQLMIEADMAFHQAIYDASGNPLIGQIAGQNWRHLHRMMGAVLQSSSQRVAVWDEHQAIAAAIATATPAAAARLVEHHCQHASTHLLAQLNSSRVQGAQAASRPQLC